MAGQSMTEGHRYAVMDGQLKEFLLFFLFVYWPRLSLTKVQIYEGPVNKERIGIPWTFLFYSFYVGHTHRYK